MAREKLERHDLPPRRDAPGTGIDRGSIRRMLELTPTERVRLLIEEVRNLEEFDRLAKRR
jgi:hypothetical protein